MLGKRHVVRQARPGQLHRDAALELAIGRDHAVVHVWRLLLVIEKQELAGALVDLGVRRCAQIGRALETHRTQRFERHRVDVVHAPGQVPHRNQPAIVELDIGVGCVLDRHVRRIGTR